MTGDATYGPVMPFLTVTSRGGPYDDEAYAAGYEMGLLDQKLGDHQRRRSLDKVVATILTANEVQADLVGMRHGYTAKIAPTDVDGWSWAVFTPSTGRDLTELHLG